ncbi:MAG TPA: lactonase family protein [Bryobacterales bacterium]|nr:lactonase family protein [Bryobacterales bacterium]
MEFRDCEHPNVLRSAVSRRGLLKGMVALAAARPRLAPAAPSGPILAYVGAYTPNGQGIYLFSMDPATGALTQISVAAATASPSWIAIHPNGKYLYAVNEISNFNGTTSGSVSAFSINRANGDLTFLNVVSSQGAGPAHLSVDPLGQFVYVANYGGGSIAVLPIMSDGSLANASDVHVDTGSVGPTHATDAPPGSFAISGHDAPHAHMIQSDPAGNFVFHTDLGQDRIYSWLLDRTNGTLSPNPAGAFLPVPPGDGPRHFAFHPNGQWFYSLQEEASTMLFFSYNATNGLLTQQQMLSTLPAGFVGTNFTSEVRVSQDGNFVYAANRLHDTIAIFAVGKTGGLTLLGEESTLGDYPRSFTIDPTGSFLYSCNQRSDAITAHRVGAGGSKLTFTGQYTPVGSPAIIVFLT